MRCEDSSSLSYIVSLVCTPQATQRPRGVCGKISETSIQLALTESTVVFVRRRSVCSSREKKNSASVRRRRRRGKAISTAGVVLDFAAAIETSHGANDRLTDCAARQPDGGRAAGEWTDGHSGRRNQMWNNWFRKAIRQSVLQACSGETTTFRRR